MRTKSDRQLQFEMASKWIKADNKTALVAANLIRVFGISEELVMQWAAISEAVINGGEGEQYERAGFSVTAYRQARKDLTAVGLMRYDVKRQVYQLVGVRTLERAIEKLIARETAAQLLQKMGPMTKRAKRVTEQVMGTKIVQKELALAS